MWLSQATHSLNRVVNLISRAINRVAGGILVVMMFLTAMDVLLRYIFNRPISGALELTECMMLIVVAFGLAYCAVLKGHVRVELVVERLPQRTQAIINSFTYLLSLGLLLLITRQCIIYMKMMLDSKLTSAVLLIPSFPFVAILALGMAVLLLTLLVDFINFVLQAAKQ